jgi:hypothetical protein
MMYIQRHRYALNVCSCIGHHPVEFPSVQFGTFRRQLTCSHSLTTRDPSLEYGTHFELSPRVSTQEHLREKFRLFICTDARCRNSIVQCLFRFSR